MTSPKLSRSIITEIESSPRKESAFLEKAASFAQTAEEVISSLRRNAHPYETPNLEELICPDLLQDESITIESISEVLKAYFSQIDLSKELGLNHQKDVVANNTAKWMGDAVTWQREVYPSLRQSRTTSQ